MSPHGTPEVRVGQQWRRTSDDELFVVDQQAVDKSADKDPDDWRLRSVETSKLGNWIFGFSIRRFYTLESEAPA